MKPPNQDPGISAWMTARNPQCGDIDTIVGGHRNTRWDQELHELNSGQLEEENGSANQLDPSHWDQELRELGTTQVEETVEGGGASDALGTS